jgi:hypothetical protein
VIITCECSTYKHPCAHICEYATRDPIHLTTSFFYLQFLQGGMREKYSYICMYVCMYVCMYSCYVTCIVRCVTLPYMCVLHVLYTSIIPYMYVLHVLYTSIIPYVYVLHVLYTSIIPYMYVLHVLYTWYCVPLYYVCMSFSVSRALCAAQERHTLYRFVYSTYTA